MKIYNIKFLFAALCASFLVVGCSNDDDDNGGGTPPPAEVDFTGTYSQVDHMGRPGINTVLSGSADIKNMHNVTIPSMMQATFQADFEAQLEGLHDAYAVLLGFTAEQVNYEPNILGVILNGGMETSEDNPNPVSAAVLTTVLSNDVLEVAPNAPTTYFNPGSGYPGFDGAIGFTGRTLQDDVIDVSLILLFGGETGARFNGQDGFPQLVTDGVAITADNITTSFPYIGAPE
ncbi:uncharacterized protein DUF4331 [Gillisia sp. Hel_I_86]|uniref:DUF4331 family protein n=1 Tax=Gillisia sp. Hel_I_86 TaxID=1249981 RepID=UPI00119B8011|nr:DUF4331 family protein [Gillisia sp. Hel_I_86]TVZ26244.1 uncharacterized protein DUF4331 [Gillisia sp. Hel_I_86]